MDCLEREYGIKEENYYSICFKSDAYGEIYVKGKILNFSSSQMVFKSDKGLFIIKPRNVIEMIPLKTKIVREA